MAIDFCFVRGIVEQKQILGPLPVALEFHGRHAVPKVLVACTDVTYCDRLLVSFQPHPEFQLCLTADEGFATVVLATKIKPRLIVLELEPEPKRLVIAETLKLLMPEVPVFVIARMTWELEKDAVSRGVDAVFDKDGDFSPVIENAKAALAWEPAQPEG
jgi:hypothetical protein